MDAAVLEALDCLRRHPTRFRNFYDKLRRDFHRTSRRNHPYAFDYEIDEAIDEVCVSVFTNKRGGFSPSGTTLTHPLAFEGALTAYLIGAARLQLSSILRARRLKEDRELPLTDTDTDAKGENTGQGTGKQVNDADLHALGLDSPFPSQEESLEATRRAAILERCLAALTALARDTMSLALRGHDDEYIRDTLGASSAGTVRRRVSETKQLLIACARRALGDNR